VRSRAPRAQLVAAFVAALAVIPSLAAACPVCFGDPDSGASRGLRAAIVLMLGATGLVGGGLVAFVIRLRRLSRRNDG
jgi:hypothetical protein